MEARGALSMMKVFAGDNNYSLKYVIVCPADKVLGSSHAIHLLGHEVEN